MVGHEAGDGAEWLYDGHDEHSNPQLVVPEAGRNWLVSSQGYGKGCYQQQQSKALHAQMHHVPPAVVVLSHKTNRQCFWRWPRAFCKETLQKSMDLPSHPSNPKGAAAEIA